MFGKAFMALKAFVEIRARYDQPAAFNRYEELLSF